MQNAVNEHSHAKFRSRYAERTGRAPKNEWLFGKHGQESRQDGGVGRCRRLGRFFHHEIRLDNDLLSRKKRSITTENIHLLAYDPGKALLVVGITGLERNFIRKIHKNLSFYFFFYYNTEI